MMFRGKEIIPEFLDIPSYQPPRGPRQDTAGSGDEEPFSAAELLLLRTCRAP